MAVTRERQLVQTFVELADTLVSDFDVVDFLHLLTLRTTELLDAAEAGLLLADQTGTLHVMASSHERTRSLELFQLQNGEGPCYDCYHGGAPVLVDDLEGQRERWPSFVPEALAAGFASVHALPLRLRDETIGALNLFGSTAGRLNEADLAAGQAMADIATIGILQQRAIHQAHTTVGQLQGALDSRVVVEQAKGVLAERAGLGMDEAFAQLRRYARSHNRRLSDVAHEVIDGTLDSKVLISSATKASGSS